MGRPRCRKSEPAALHDREGNRRVPAFLPSSVIFEAAFYLSQPGTTAENLTRPSSGRPDSGESGHAHPVQTEFPQPPLKPLPPTSARVSVLDPRFIRGRSRLHSSPPVTTLTPDSLPYLLFHSSSSPQSLRAWHGKGQAALITIRSEYRVSVPVC